MKQHSRPKLRSLPPTGDPRGAEPEPGLWRVLVTFAGDPVAEPDLTRALQRLHEANPIGMSIRYAPDRAEVSYWDEAPDAEDAAAMALRVWCEHRTALGLPDWEVVALQVHSRQTWEEHEPRLRGLVRPSAITRLLH